MSERETFEVLGARPLVVPDDEGDGRLVRQQDVELRLGEDHVLRVRPHGRDRLVEEEVAAAGGCERDREESAAPR